MLAAAAVAETPPLTAVGDVVTVKGGKGKAVIVKAGQYLKVVNTYGEQVVDFFCFSYPDLQEVLSMHHTHDTIGKLIPRPGDGLFTNCRNEIMTFLEDSGPGVHDTTVAACDYYLYVSQIGAEAAEQHDSCTNNLHNALAELGMKLTDTPRRYLPPAPFNLWMAVSLADEGSHLTWDPPAAGQKPGDHVLFRANMDCVAVMSACPHDIVDPTGKNGLISGVNGPQDVHFQLFEA